VHARAATIGVTAVVRLLAKAELPVLAPIGSRSYFGWYEREEIFDLRRSATVAEARRRLRLRPEAWAFFDDGRTRLYPLLIADVGNGNDALDALDEIQLTRYAVYNA